MATRPPPELVLVSGMSGAGRSTAADVLEDLGCFVVDNLPPELLPTIVERSRAASGRSARSRSSSTSGPVRSSPPSRARWRLCRARGLRPTLLFLEADDDVLVRRFESVRRPHPLQGEEGRVLDGIAREREVLRELRADADLVIDTSNLNVHELTAKLVDAFGGADDQIAAGDDHVVRLQVRHPGRRRPRRRLPVPAEPALGAPSSGRQSGLDTDVREYVLRQAAALPFLDAIREPISLSGARLSATRASDSRRSRSAAPAASTGASRIAEELGARLRTHGVGSLVVHRDLGHE